MGFPEGMATSDQRCRVFVIHPHPAEGLADGVSGELWIRLASRALGIHVNQAHLCRSERTFQFSCLGAAIGTEPLAFRPPVNFFGPPGIDATTRETKRFEAHGLHGDCAGEDQQVCPRDLPTVLLLERPEQTVRFVQVRVIRPAVERRKALHTSISAPSAVDGSIGAGTVPSHSNEERPVVAKVRRPPVLGSDHQLLQV